MTLYNKFHSYLNNADGNLPQAFSPLAGDLFQNYILQAGEKTYWLTEIEFYYFADGHEDPFCKRQWVQPRETKLPEVPSDQFFFHYTGVDISFDNDAPAGPKHTYGGILIRGLQDADSGDLLAGPLLCICALANNAQKTNSALVLRPATVPRPGKAKWTSAHRIGLNPKTSAKYAAYAYRYYIPKNLLNK